MSGAGRPRARFDRDVDGILLLDKRAGVTSNRALQEARILLRAKRAGHTGSLDPLATGLLPLCFGEATKFAGHLLDADKRYEVEAALGAATDTGDAEGEVSERLPVPAFDAAALGAALASLTGEIEQVPPMYSALKRGGVPLYKLARRGEQVARAPRRVTIHAFEPVAVAPERLSLRVHCSKGTYVRTLVEDLGRALGTCAHVAALRRTTAGPFGPGGLVTAEQLARLAGDLAGLDALLLPVDAGLGDHPEVRLGSDAASFLAHGQAVRSAAGPEGLVRVYGPVGFLGLCQRHRDGTLEPKRLVARPVPVPPQPA
jgi:tRNA pseudouridine55 synthase